MANNPKKVKDPTEVALSAIQEALNIGETSGTDDGRSSVHGEAASSSSTSPYGEGTFDVRPECRPPGLRADRGAARAAPRRQ